MNTNSESSFLLSIVVPTFNRLESLRLTLDSIFTQLDHSIENIVQIIVSDNNSSDGTIDLLDEFNQKNVEININESNLGYIKNFKIGISKAKGKYVWLVGSDDILDKGAVKKILSILQGSDVFQLIFLNYYCLLPGQYTHGQNLNENTLKAPRFIKERKNEGVYPLKSIVGFNIDMFTAIYSFILRKESWIEALELFDSKFETFDTASNCYPHAFYIAKNHCDSQVYYIDSPILYASYEVGWRKYIPLCLMQYLPDLYETWLKHGVSHEVIRSLKRRLLDETSHFYLIKQITQDSYLSSKFSIFNYCKRFWRIYGFQKVIVAYLRINGKKTLKKFHGLYR